MFKSKIIYNSYFHIFTLTLLFLVIELIVYPIGNFSLNDEWLYSRIVFDFYRTNVISPEHWEYTSMLSHILFGYTFVSIFGCSYLTLHLSTLTLSIAGVIFFYFLLKDFFVNSALKAFLLTLVLLINPLFVSLSNSFMTDVPFISTLIMGLYFYLKNRKTNQSIYLIFSALFFIWNILTRQLGIAFVIGICVSEFFIDISKSKAGLLLLIISFLSLFFFEYWLHSENHVTIYRYLFFKNQSHVTSNTISYTIINFSKRWIHYISFSGFVLFPILLPKFLNIFITKEYSKNKIITLITFIAFIPVVWSMRKFPIGNYFYNTGVGAETLYDTYIKCLNLQHSHSVIFYIIKSITYLSAFALLFCLIDFFYSIVKTKFNPSKITLPILVLINSLFIYYSMLAFSSPIFDRYIIIFSIFIIPILARYLVNKKLILSGIIILGVFSTLATKDYFAGHRTRNLSISFLKNNYHISDSLINGGLEHESTVFYTSKNWFMKWNNIPKSLYLISYGKVPEYKTFTYFTYQRYIPYKIDTIFTLKHDASQ